MSVDREQTRRDVERYLDESAYSSEFTRDLARDYLALLTELEQAERLLADNNRQLHETAEKLEQAKAALEELRPHIQRLEESQRTNRERIISLEAHLAKVPASVEAETANDALADWKGVDE